MNHVPSPEVISGYEKLGIVGILVFVLFIGLIVIVWAVKQLRSLAAQFFGFVTHQTAALTKFSAAHEEQQETQVRLHERMDSLFSCTRAGCPVFEMRKKQHKDAARATQENPVPANPPHPIV